MHFNEMSVKSRQLGLTFVVAALGLAAILISRGQGHGVSLFGLWYLHISTFIVLIAAAGMYAVRVLDLKVYHGMLRGAVEFGNKLEEELRADGLFNAPKGMTESITVYSRFEKVNKENFTGEGKEINAFEKISKFYNWSIWILLLIAIGLAFAFKDVEVDTIKKAAPSEAPATASTTEHKPMTKMQGQAPSK